MPLYSKAIKRIKYYLNSPTNDIMIDIEALGTKPGSIVFQIGACMFNAQTGRIGSKIEINIDIANAAQLSLTKDQPTLDWWEKQGGIPQLPNTVSVLQAFNDLEQWIAEHKPKKFWAWGITYDFPLLEAVFNRINWENNKPLPWKYHAVRDARTTWDLAFPGVIHSRGPHSALEDCINQCKQVAITHEKLGLVPFTYSLGLLVLRIRRFFYNLVPTR